MDADCQTTPILYGGYNDMCTRALVHSHMKGKRANLTELVNGQLLARAQRGGKRVQVD